MLALYEQNKNMIVVVMSDKAYLYLNGDVNKQNCWYWVDENPSQLYQKPLHNPKITAWCAMRNLGVINSYFSEENKVNVTVAFTC